jgi:WD40 repeat protein
MSSAAMIRIPVMLLVIATCIIGAAAAVSVGVDWRQAPTLTENRFFNIVITPDASTVFAAGSQLLVRSWDGETHWGGQAGFNAAMSEDGKYVVAANDITITLYNATGSQVWSRNMNGQVRAVAIAPDASFVISADDMGNYNTWSSNGELIGRNKTDVAKRVAIAPTGNLVVMTTEKGMRYTTPSLQPVWTDSQEGSLDDMILISADGATVITAGGSRLSSHSRNGTLNWKTDVTDTAINDVACSDDCSLIVVGTQDNSVKGIDRYGKTHWTYKTGQWTNAVGMSRNGGIIAAGANDGSLFILDHNGNLLTKKTFDSRIQPRSVAVSRDGTRIVVADRFYLYGLPVFGTTASVIPDETVFIAPTLNPVPKTTITTVATTMPVVEEAAEETAVPTPTPVKKSPAGILIVLSAIAGAGLLARKLQE